MSETNRIATAQPFNLELGVLESEFDTMALRCQESIVETLSAGTVPDSQAVDDLHRFLNELRERVTSATALGAVVAQPLRLQQLRGELERIVNDENWQAHRAEWQDEMSLVGRIECRSKPAPAFFDQLKSQAESFLQTIENRSSATPDEIQALQTKSQVYRDLIAILNDPAKLDDKATEAALGRLTAEFGVGMITAIYRSRLFIAPPVCDKAATEESPAIAPRGSDTGPDNELGLSNHESAAASQSEASVAGGVDLASRTALAGGASASAAGMATVGDRQSQAAVVVPVESADTRPRKATDRRKLICPECQQKEVLLSRVRWSEMLIWLLGWRAFRCIHCQTRFWKWSSG